MPSKTDPTRPDPNALQYIDLADFTPGIFSDWQSAGGIQPAPDGAAQLNGTFSCVASPTGGLMAAPLRVNRIQETLLEVDGAGHYPPNDNNAHITAFRVLSPVNDRTGIVSGNTDGTIRAFPDNLFVAFEYYYGTANNWAHKSNILVYKAFLLAAANPAIGTVSTYSILAQATTPPAPAPYYYGYSSVDLSRSNKSTPTAAGFPYAGVAFTSNKDITVTGAVAYPSNATNTTDSVDTALATGLTSSGGSAAYGVFAHQDRMFAMSHSINEGAGTDADLPFDGLIGTSANDYSTNGITLETFVNENPGAFGSWVSMNSSELFMVKQQKGGFSLRGDVGSPTVLRYPGIEPTFDATNIGCMTNDGLYLYGTARGVYAWSGGDTSTLLSPQLDGWFWKPGSGIQGVDNYRFTKGSFAKVGRWIFAPNNFLYDQQAKSWWKLNNNPSVSPTYAWWDSSAAALAVGCTAYVNATQTVLADWYDPQQGQQSFQWTSQPLARSRGRFLDIREVDIVASGAGLVTLSAYGVDGAIDSTSVAVTGTATPQIFGGLSLNVKSTDIVVQLTSDSGVAGTPAPRIHRITLGYHEAETGRY